MDFRKFFYFVNLRVLLPGTHSLNIFRIYFTYKNDFENVGKQIKHQLIDIFTPKKNILQLNFLFLIYLRKNMENMEKYGEEGVMFNIYSHSIDCNTLKY